MTSKIWIISEYYYPVLHSTGYYITEIAEELAKSRDNVNVICTNAKYYKTDEKSSIKNEIRNNVTIHRLITGNIDKNNFFLRAIRLFYASIRLFFKIFLLVSKDDEVLIVTNPAFLILAMPILKKIKKIKYKILVHDIFPENLIAIGKIKSNSIVSIWLKKLFDFSYSQGNLCIAIGRDMMKILNEKTSGKSKIIMIPNWAETSYVTPLEKQNTELVKKLGLQDKFTFQFAGNLGHSQGIKNLLDAIKLVNKEEIHFLFIGSGALEDEIKHHVSQSSGKNTSLIGFLNRSEQNDFLNACDVAIVTLNSGMLGLGVPSKSYNIMAAGKPILVIADENSEISLCVKENNIGWVVPPDNPEYLAETFEKIYNDFRSNKIPSGNPRRIAESKYAKEIILNEFDSLF